MSANRMCQCTRCRNKHLESERIEEPRKGDAFASEMCCPRCRCRSYYDITPAEGRKTCDKPLCEAHAREIGRNKHLCPSCHLIHLDASGQRSLFTSLI